MKEEWKKQMQQKMADYRESDIEVSWEEIEKALTANKRRARVVSMRMRGIAAAVVVLLLAGGGYYWMQQEQREMASPSNSAVASEKVAASASEDASAPRGDVAPASEDGGAPVSAFAPVQNLVAQAIAAVKAETEAEKTAIIPETNEAQVPQDVVAQSQEAEPQTEEAEPQSQKVETQASTAQHREAITQQLPPLYPSDLRKSNSSQSRLTAKVYLSNTMASMSGGSQFDDITKLQYGLGYKSHNEGGENGEHYSEVNDDKDQKPKENPYVPAYISSSRELVDHRQPVRFGFSFRYRLDNRWSIESGLTYTRLSADITHSAKGKKTESEQRLNYIGIPLSASYQMWGSRYFNFYLSAGGLVEKMVKGSRTTQGTTNSVSIRPLQLSVNGAVGAEFKFIDNLSLYAEPSLNYYFDNGSAVPTFYQDKPLNFNLNVGLRFNIK